jgi:catecholate siderophore receptor
MKPSHKVTSVGTAVRALLRKAVAGAALAVMTMPALAEETSVPAVDATAEKEATVLPKITVKDLVDADSYRANTSQIAKLPQSLRDIPQSLTVVNRAVLDAQAATRLTDALRNVPGITISAGEGGQIGDNINLRGFSARTDLFLDGFRDRGQYSRDTFFLEAVEVLKGPSSIGFGRGSTGGVINQASKRPSLRAATEVTASAGTDDYYRVTADVNHPLSDTSALRVVALGHDSKSTRDVIESQRYGLNPSVRFGIGTLTEVTLSALLQRNRDIPDYGFPLVQFQASRSKPIDAPANKFFGFTNDRYDQDVNNLSVTIQHRMGESATLTNLSQYTKYRTTAAPTPLGGLVNPTTGATVAQPLAAGTPLESLWSIRQQRDRVIDDSSLYNQTNLTMVVPAGRLTHTFVGGVEFGRDEYHNDTFSRFNATATASPLSNVSPMPAINLGDPAYEAKPELSSSLLRLQTARTQANADTLAGFINDQIELTAQWKVVVGVRWDQFKADQNATTYAYAFPIANPAAPAPTLAETRFRTNDAMWSERAGVIWQPDERQSYYASYGTSFNPSAEAVTLTAATAPLDPEKNRSFEIGAKFNLFGDTLALTTAVFRVEKTNARTADPVTATVTVLDGLTRVEGFEIGAVGKLTDSWQVMTGYSFLDGKIVRSNDVGAGISAGIPAEGHALQNTPRHAATVWTTYRVGQAWEIGGGAVYSDKRFVNNFETAAIDGYVRVDATVAFVQPRYDLRLNLLNVTDETYFETASAGRATPATGRTVIATLAYRF